MKLMVCPECKEVIAEGELRGTNKQCHACWLRENRDDLIEIDTEKAVESQKNEKIQSQFSQSTMPQSEQNMLYGSAHAELNKLPPSLRNAMSNLLSLRNQAEAPVPVIHSLRELTLIPGAEWDYSNGMDDHSRTLLLRSQASKSLLTFAIIWLAFTVPLLSFFLIAMLNDPSTVTVNGHPGTSSDIWFFLLFPVIFWGVGIGMLYAGITSVFYKTWIDITPSTLIIERGMRRKGSGKAIQRTAMTSVTMDSNSTVNGVPMYVVRISDGTEVKVASGLPYNRAHQLVVLLKTLLSAQL